MTTEEDLKQIIKRELPALLQDTEMRRIIVQAVDKYFAGKQETESRFDQILAELRQDREEQRRKWDENQRIWDENQLENQRKWDENQRKWDENQLENQRKWDENQHKLNENEKRIDQTLQEIKRLGNKHDSTIGALGARWGLYTEQSFRNALQGILQDSFNVEVVSITEYDDQGEVFGRPDQIELDLIIQNGTLIIAEIKSSMSKSDMYTFMKKVLFYEKRHQRQATRKLVISPMVHPAALTVAQNLGIDVYSYAEDVDLTNGAATPIS
ncbi:hypothetical protein C7H19_11330 [Aphanothece hegewaldii CCALA 016]|uniref:DUF3782 domain-containing protein n=1 Tax=Aphanothece hegewaldii CCALA 016 TaxID=2107694 RepID=A0A2T1LY37_9CHRO|nr:DUF3782 domain-containing protein [Aphanothece hegewaldii]PSF37302.1 hypothetical protein C7H19_11330 [Aphanothece hegewaldii CCALA 016]